MAHRNILRGSKLLLSTNMAMCVIPFLQHWRCMCGKNCMTLSNVQSVVHYARQLSHSADDTGRAYIVGFCHKVVCYVDSCHCDEASLLFACKMLFVFYELIVNHTCCLPVYVFLALRHVHRVRYSVYHKVYCYNSIFHNALGRFLVYGYFVSDSMHRSISRTSSVSLLRVAPISASLSEMTFACFRLL